MKVDYNLSTILDIISDPEMPEPGEELTFWDGCSPVLVSASDLLKHRRATHFLDGCSPVLVSGSDLLKHWRATHKLDGCSHVHVSGSDLLKN